MIPIRNNVLVKPFPSGEISEGGILVPESARPVSNKLTVVAVGKGTKDKPMFLKPGDTGFRVKDWGEEILINDERHYIMDASAIIATQ